MNRGTRFCRPLRHHSATWPGRAALYQRARRPTIRCLGLCSGRHLGQGANPRRVVSEGGPRYKPPRPFLKPFSAMQDYATQRRNMVDSQVRANDVTDQRVIAAMRQIPREMFVPGTKLGVVYADAPVEVVPGRYLLQPRTFAKLLQLAAVGPNDVVLDVGCATGYSTAVIAQLARTAIGLEQDAGLVRVASETVPATGCKNASVVQGALVEGFRQKAPYDAIFIDGAVEKVPEALLSQLAEGGRLVAVVGSGSVGRAHLYLREHGRVGHRIAFDAPAPLLAGFRQTVGFVF